MQHESPPPTPLAQLPARLWTIDEAQDDYNQSDIAPDTTIDLVANLGAPLFHETPRHGWAETPRLMVKALLVRPLRLRATGRVHLVGLRLPAWLLPALRGDTPPLQPLAATTRASCPRIERIDQNDVIALLTEIALDATRSAAQTPVRAVVEAIQAAQSSGLPHDLGRQVGLSLSQVRRRTAQALGLSPKRLARLVRFEATRNRLWRAPGSALASLALELGYADQAHLTREFTTLAGLSPRAWVARQTSRAPA